MRQGVLWRKLSAGRVSGLILLLLHAMTVPALGRMELEVIWSVEWQVDQAEAIAIGTMENVSGSNQFIVEEWLKGRGSNTLSLTGAVPSPSDGRTVIFLLSKGDAARDPSHASQFSTLTTMGTAQWSMDGTPVNDPTRLLELIREAVKHPATGRRSVWLELNITTNFEKLSFGRTAQLVVPADQRLENIGRQFAKIAIAPSNNRNYNVATNALRALADFRSTENAALLRQLRGRGVESWFEHGRLAQHFDPVRWKAASVLATWEMPFNPPPIEPDVHYWSIGWLLMGIGTGVVVVITACCWRQPLQQKAAVLTAFTCMALLTVLIRFGWPKADPIGVNDHGLDVHWDRPRSQWWIAVLPGRLQIDRAPDWPGTEWPVVSAVHPESQFLSSPQKWQNLPPRGLRAAVLDSKFRGLWTFEPSANWSAQTTAGIEYGAGTTFYHGNAQQSIRMERVRVPIAYPIAVVALPPTLLAILTLRRQLIRRRRRRDGRCLACGYDLRSSPQRCPECGAVVSVRREQPTKAVKENHDQEEQIPHGNQRPAE